MNDFHVRTMLAGDRDEVAELIHLSTNTWYKTHGHAPIFIGDPALADAFFDVYEALDPGCGLVVENIRTRRLVGSCFYHPRPTHVSLGIMNVHPNYFGRGIAKLLLDRIIGVAERAGVPVRLVSSAMNLDSYSLYTRAGFVPRRAFQDMYLKVPPEGLPVEIDVAGTLRNANTDDIPAMLALERELTGIDRSKDFAYFIDNAQGYWHVSALEDNGLMQGFLVSCRHPGMEMLGPGVSRTEEHATALMLRELNEHRGGQPVFLAPVDCGKLVRTLYGWGARNCDLHFAQVRGEAAPLLGVVLPTFLPESG